MPHKYPKTDLPVGAGMPANRLIIHAVSAGESAPTGEPPIFRKGHNNIITCLDPGTPQSGKAYRLYTDNNRNCQETRLHKPSGSGPGGQFDTAVSTAPHSHSRLTDKRPWRLLKIGQIACVVPGNSRQKFGEYFKANTPPVG